MSRPAARAGGRLPNRADTRARIRALARAKRRSAAVSASTGCTASGVSCRPRRGRGGGWWRGYWADVRFCRTSGCDRGQWPRLERAVEKDCAGDSCAWELDDKVRWTEDAVLAAERRAIRWERPVHNVAHNGNNPAAVTRARRRMPLRLARRRVRLGGYAVAWICWPACCGGWRAGSYDRLVRGLGAVGATVVVSRFALRRLRR